VRSIVAQPDAAAVWAQHGRIVAELVDRFPQAADLLAEAAPDLLTFNAFPVEHWRVVWSTNPQEMASSQHTIAA
jgi:transposase-like protein